MIRKIKWLTLNVGYKDPHPPQPRRLLLPTVPVSGLEDDEETGAQMIFQN